MDSKKDNMFSFLISAIAGAITAGAIEGLVNAFVTGDIAQSPLIQALRPYTALVGFLIGAGLVYFLVGRKISSNKPISPSLLGPLQEKDINVLVESGLINTALELTDSEYTPENSMRQASKRLYFMGLLGSKWVIQPHVRNTFRAFLRRIETTGGAVRFLLIDPDGVSFQKIQSARGEISTESIPHWRDLVKEFKCLEVHLYSQIPCFRITLLDENILVLAPYKITQDGYSKSKYGWSVPHLVFRRDAPWSYYESFERYFNEMWNLSKPLN